MHASCFSARGASPSAGRASRTGDHLARGAASPAPGFDDAVEGASAMCHRGHCTAGGFDRDLSLSRLRRRRMLSAMAIRRPAGQSRTMLRRRRLSDSCSQRHVTDSGVAVAEEFIWPHAVSVVRRPAFESPLAALARGEVAGRASHERKHGRSLAGNRRRARADFCIRPAAGSTQATGGTFFRIRSIPRMRRRDY